jgi:hypothetical protein
MTTERHDELMTGLYLGTAPGWLPTANQPLFERESLRRRADLCQTIQQYWRCTAFLARSTLSDDFLCEAFRSFPGTRHRAGNIVTAVYLSLETALRTYSADLPTRELFLYESLGARDLLHPTAAEIVPDAIRAAAGLPDGAVVHRFSTAVAATHVRMLLYASAGAPASFARDYRALRRTSYVAQTPGIRKPSVDEVTSAVESALQEKDAYRA